MRMTEILLHSKTCCWQAGLACLLLTVAGCGGGGPTLVSVKGTVTVDGSEPFANGTVRFTPKSPGKLRGSFAKTDDEGKYVLIHQSQRLGAEPGEFNVSFSLQKLRDGSPMPEADASNDDEGTPLEMRPVEFVPAEYASLSSTKNTTTVPSTGGKFDFDIPKLKTVEEATAAPAPPLGGGSRRRRDN